MTMATFLTTAQLTKQASKAVQSTCNRAVAFQAAPEKLVAGKEQRKAQP
jgi:hypothetical protein